MKPLDLTSPSELLLWLKELRTQADDLWGACDDATRPPSKRVLGRTEARRLAKDAFTSIEQMLNAALVSLGQEPEEPAPSSTTRPR